jgi:hypothetical protein
MQVAHELMVPFFITGIESILSQSKSVRNEVISLLEQALFGDKLAAEYLLCHLVSSV